MLDNPWNAPPRPNADDPSPRTVVPMFPHRLAQAMRDDDAGYARPAPKLTTYERKLRETRHVVIPPVTWRSEIAEDFRDFVREVRRSPYSHALVAVLTVVAWTAALIAPLLIGEWF